MKQKKNPILNKVVCWPLGVKIHSRVEHCLPTGTHHEASKRAGVLRCDYHSNGCL